MEMVRHGARRDDVARNPIDVAEGEPFLSREGSTHTRDPTFYLVWTFVLGLALGAALLSPFVVFFKQIREPWIAYVVGVLLLGITAAAILLWQTTDDGQAGFALFGSSSQASPSSWRDNSSSGCALGVRQPHPRRLRPVVLRELRGESSERLTYLR